MKWNETMKWNSVKKASVIFLLIPGSMLAQSIRATVVNGQSGMPVADVYVRVLNSSLATITDQDGKFEMDSLPSHAKLLLTAVGYQSVEQTITGTTSRIEMVTSPIYLNNNITVTAKRFETNQNDISEGVTIVNSQELQQTIPRSTPEALIGSAGVWVQKTNHGGGSPVIRGLVGNQILLMVDGIRMNNATYRYGPNQYLATIDPGLIERIELIRGNGSVLYGSDAIGGVVQVISRTPHFRSDENNFHGRITGKWMSGAMEKSGRAEGQWNGERIAALAGFSIRDFGNIVGGGSLGTLDPTGYNEFAGDGKILFKTGTTGVLTAAWQHHQQNNVPRYDQVEQGGYSLYAFDPQIRQLGYLRWETFTDNNLINTIRLTAGLNRSAERLRSMKAASSDLKYQEDIVNTFNGTAEFHSSLNDSWQAQSGVEWFYDIVDSKAKVINTATQAETGVRGSYADQASSRSIALFSTHTFDLRKFNLSAGARFNAVSLSVNDPTFGNQKIQPYAVVGNLGVGYAVLPHVRIFMNSSTGFRAPNVDDVSKFGTVESTVFEIPSADLSPERSRSFEGGFKVNAKSFSAALTAYRTRLIDLIERI
ncbi:MAG: TonB-dependent receptor, partial [Cyclobacteriaceae bacterium]